MIGIRLTIAFCCERSQQNAFAQRMLPKSSAFVGSNAWLASRAANCRLQLCCNTPAIGYGRAATAELLRPRF